MAAPQRQWPSQPEELPATDDDTLVARAKDDPAAFAALYRRYVDPIYRYCHRRLGSKEAAEDVTARVFTQALVALPDYRDDREGSFRGWLFAIAHNAVANDLRANRSHQPLDRAAALRDPTPDPEENALAADDRRTLHRLLAALPPDQRRLLELRLAGLSGPEIAHVLGKTHGAVKVAQFRAIARLRALLDDTSEESTHEDR